MGKNAALLLMLAVGLRVIAHSPDFISRYVENSKLLYADNGYEVVKEKTFDAADLQEGNPEISYTLAPGDYFVQMITEPCCKMNVCVNAPSQEKEMGMISEKPQMRTAIAIFDVPVGKTNPTAIKLEGLMEDYCQFAKAQIVVYRRTSN